MADPVQEFQLTDLTGVDRSKPLRSVLDGLANGLTPKEIARREDEIAEFSGLGEFIDDSIKTYSSGMYGRLGFAVALSMESGILLIDEALSAGDAAFAEQAEAKIKDLMSKERAITLVSHGLGNVQEMATRVLWLDRGKMMQIDDPETVVDAYTGFVKVGTSPMVMDQQ